MFDFVPGFVQYAVIGFLAERAIDLFHQLEHREGIFIAQVERLSREVLFLHLLGEHQVAADDVLDVDIVARESSVAPYQNGLIQEGAAYGIRDDPAEMEVSWPVYVAAAGHAHRDGIGMEIGVADEVSAAL